MLLRIAEMAEQVDGCWLWRCRSRQISIAGKMVAVAPLAFEAAHGRPPSDPYLWRICGNTQCVRPSHLRERGTHIGHHFESKVARSEDPDGCDTWTGAMVPSGYGHMFVDGRYRKATHVALLLATGEWPNGIVCHHCDNPSCVKVSHLFIGTQQDNVDDMWRKGRAKPRSKYKRVLETMVSLRKAGLSYTAIGQRVGVSQMTALRALKKHGGEYGLS